MRRISRLPEDFQLLNKDFADRSYVQQTGAAATAEV